MSKTKVICITNQKGGVGKTTTTANLAYSLAQNGKDVLLIDYDSQASLSYYLNVDINHDKYYSIYHMMLKNLRTVSPEEDEFLAGLDIETDEGFAELCRECIIRPTYMTRDFVKEEGKRKVVDLEKEFGFDLIPSNLALSDYELELLTPKYSQNSIQGLRLYDIVQRIIRYHEYDYILIDTNPSLGVMTMNAICAATAGVLIPTNMDLLSTAGVESLVNRIGGIQELMLNKGIIHMGVIGIVLNLYAETRTVDKTIEEDMNKFYPFKIFTANIPESVNAKRAVMSGLIYSQIYPKAEQKYKQLAKELEKTIDDMTKAGQVIQYLDNQEEEGEVDE